MIFERQLINEEVKSLQKWLIRSIKSKDNNEHQALLVLARYTIAKRYNFESWNDAMQASDQEIKDATFFLQHDRNWSKLGFDLWESIYDGTETDQWISITMDENPLLTNAGLGIPGANEGFCRPETFELERWKLRASSHRIGQIVEYLQSNVGCGLGKVNTDITSEELAHLLIQVRMDDGLSASKAHITNGQVITAAFILAARHKRVSNSVNVYLSINKHWLARTRMKF